MIEVTRIVALKLANLRSQAIAQLPHEVQNMVFGFEDDVRSVFPDAIIQEQKVSFYPDFKSLLLRRPARSGQQSVLLSRQSEQNFIVVRSKELGFTERPEVEITADVENSKRFARIIKETGKDEIVVVYHTKKGKRVTLPDMV